MTGWRDIKERLPEDGEKVIAYLPDNKQYLPGKTGEERFEPIVILKFVETFFKEGTDKFNKHGSHFWLGEGKSNHYFPDVSHWMPLPEGPNNES